MVCITFSGGSCLDQKAQARFVAGPAPSGVAFSDPQSLERRVIATRDAPAPGAKVTAQDPITQALLDALCDSPVPGGGPLNQSLRFAAHANDACQVCFVDTSPPADCVAAACAARRVDLVSLARHGHSINVVTAYENDKLIVRNPVQLDGRELDGGSRRRIASAVTAVDVAVCVSPKDAAAASEFLRAAPQATRYLQPTGSLPAEPTLELARQCDGLACNGSELGDWAIALGMGTPHIDESAPEAAGGAVTLLSDLHHRYRLPLGVGAITLGRRGCVVVDFRLHRGWVIEIESTDCNVPTPSGAGDFWHAMWIYYREVERLGEPWSAAAATETVAAAIGLSPGTFEVRVSEVGVAARGLGHSPRVPSPLHLRGAEVSGQGNRTIGATPRIVG